MSSIAQVPDIAVEYPQMFKRGELERLYMTFLEDPKDEIKRQSFKLIGRFIYSVQNIQKDSPLILKYLTTGKSTRSKETLYDCAYNLPAVALSLRAESWELVYPLFVRLSQSDDQGIMRTLSHSMFEVAKVIGKPNADDTLIPLMLEDLDSQHAEVRAGALTHLGEFLEYVSEEYRFHFLS